MENHYSSEKLVGLEAGLGSLKPPKGVLLDKKIEKKSKKCTNIIFGLLVTVLLLVISYEIWQAVRVEILMSEIEAQNLSIEDKIALPLISNEMSVTKVEEQLEHLRNTVTKMQDEILEQKATTEFPHRIISESSEVDETLPLISNEMSMTKLKEELEHLRNTVTKMQDEILEQKATNEFPHRIISESSTVDETSTEKDVHSDSIIPENFDDAEKIVPYSQEDDSLAYEVDDASIPNENHDLWYLSLYTEPVETDVMEIEESEEAASSTEGENENSEDSNVYRAYFGPYLFESRLTWKTSGDDSEYDNVEESQTEEEATEKLNNSEMTTEEPTTMPPKEYDYANYDDDSYFEWDEYSDDVEDDPTTTKSTSVLTVQTKDEEQPTADSGTEVSDQPEMNLVFERPHYDEENESSNTDETAEYSPEALNLLFERLGLLALQSQQEPFSSGLTDADPKLLQSLTTDDTDSWSYISKRSVDAVPPVDRRLEGLTSKDSGHRIPAMEQRMDDASQSIQMRESFTSGPSNRIPQETLNGFYARMEASAAFIDRLHERYLKLKHLEDDYVSREFPASSEE